MRRGEAGGNELGRGVDQRAAGFAGHMVERVDHLAQMAELQRPQREFAPAQGDGFRHGFLRKDSPQRHRGHRGHRVACAPFRLCASVVK
jgi:hypothetical protein